MDNLLRQLDRKSQQVEIEARVVAANRSFSREIGTQFGFAGAANASGSNIVGGRFQRRNQPVQQFTALPAPPICWWQRCIGGPAAPIPLADELGCQRSDQRYPVLFSSANFALEI